MTSPPSQTFSWTDEIGYGVAYKNAVDDLNQYDNGCKNDVTDKVNQWIETVKCVNSEHCEECGPPKRPFHVHPEDVNTDDKVHQETGRHLTKGTISLERTYKVQSGAVRCQCPGHVVVE